MNCKMLSKEHRIVAVPMKYEGGLHIIYNHYQCRLSESGKDCKDYGNLFDHRRA